MKANLLFPAACAAFAIAFSSCSQSNPSVIEDTELAQQVADGTIPPWIAENADPYEEGAYTTSDVHAYNPPPKPSISKTSSTRKSASSSKRRSSSRTQRSSTRKYKVKKGDTLGAIAIRYGTTVKAIKRANGLKSDLIRINQTLSIPRK